VTLASQGLRSADRNPWKGDGSIASPLQ